MFADLHTHPQGRAFNWFRNTKYELKDKFRDKYHPWTVVLSNFKQQRKGGRGFSYSQSDFVKCWNGKISLVFASMYPMEKGFFNGKDPAQKKKVSGLISILENSPVGWVSNLLFKNLLKKIALGTDDDHHSIRDYFQAILMRFPLKRINFLQSNEYDYYVELKKEYDFLRTVNGQPTKSDVYIPFIKNIFKNKKKQISKYPDSLDATGVYVLTHNYNEVEDTINAGNIAVVLTIEGMHALGTDTHPNEVLNRIDEIKQWEHPVFFITFAHHFNNFLCGHAHSIIKSATLLTDQTDGMNGPFSELGLKAARRLLSLDDNNVKDPALGSRILIDLKHTSATSRKQFYDQIVKPAAAKGDNIPVICSHVAYSGIKSLAEFEANYHLETDDYQVNEFNAWNINVCDEDIEMVVRTKGLLGLCLDQRILGQMGKKKTAGKELVWRNIRAFLDAVVSSANLSDVQKSGIWDVLCIGSDFEGYIDPADEYATVLDYEQLRSDLIHSIQTEIIDKGLSGQYYLAAGHTPDKLASKVCFENARQFLKLHF